MKEDRAYQVSFEEQKQQALKDYSTISERACHWSGFIQAAIEAYQDPNAAIPITQRTYSEQDLLDAWDAGLKNGWDNARHGHATPSKQNYLKQKFDIEIK